jgi:hypothetical protein
MRELCSVGGGERKRRAVTQAKAECIEMLDLLGDGLVFTTVSLKQ